MFRRFLNHQVLLCVVLFFSRGSTRNLTEAGATTDKIIGGEFAPLDAYPWFARMIYGDGSWAGCGGMLVAPDIVLTAAHCLWNWPSDLHVQIGAVCPYDSDNCGQPMETIPVASVLVDPLYDESNSLNHDYAILKLKEKATITPVKMDQNEFSPNYTATKKLYTIGFGLLSNNNDADLPSQLMHVELSYNPSDTCKVNYGNSLTDYMMCASNPGQSACFGDSGGPLYDPENDAVVGIVSWGPYYCAESPTVFSRISSRWTWISDIICDNYDGSPRPNFCPSTSCTDDQGMVDVILMADNFPYETSFKLKKRKRNGKFKTVFSGDLFVPNTMHSRNTCVRKGKCYKLVVFDSFGDGLCCGQDAPGYYELKWRGNVVQSPTFEEGKIAVSSTFGWCP